MFWSQLLKFDLNFYNISFPHFNNAQAIIILHCHHNLWHFIKPLTTQCCLLTLTQTTKFRLFQTQGVCIWKYWIWWKWQKVLETCRKQWEKERLLVTSNFSFYHQVFKRLVMQTCKKRGLVWEWVKNPLKEACWKHSSKMRKCSQPAFSPFPTMFSTLSKNNSTIWAKEELALAIRKLTNIKKFRPMSTCLNCAPWHKSKLFAKL